MIVVNRMAHPTTRANVPPYSEVRSRGSQGKPYALARRFDGCLPSVPCSGGIARPFCEGCIPPEPLYHLFTGRMGRAHARHSPEQRSEERRVGRERRAWGWRSGGEREGGRTASAT